MAHVREFAGVVYTFDEGGHQIDAFGQQLGGLTEEQLEGSGQPETPFTFPTEPPPPIVPPPLPTTGLYTFAVTNNLLQPAGGLTVTISRDVGSGTTRTTDNHGLASFVVPAGVQLDWTITGGAYQPQSGSAFIGAAGRTEAVVMFPIGPPPPIPIGPQPAHLRLTVHDATTGHVLPAVDVNVDDGADFAVGGGTDATGFLDVLVPLGVVRVALHAAGYVDTALTVTVAASMDLALTLGPIPPSPSPSPTPGTTPAPTPGPTPTPSPSPGPGGGGPIDDSGARPPSFAVPAVRFDTISGVRSIAAPSLRLLEVPTFGFSPASLIGTIISGIAALFGGGGSGSDVAKISNRLDRIGDFVLSLAQTLETATARETHVDTQAGNLFDRIVGSVLGPIINALAAVIRGGSGDLGKLFGPITHGLNKLLDTVRHLYTTWLKPILHAIDITRQILRVLNALGLEFAGTLDRQLGRLEGKLTAPILLVQSKINELRNQVNRIVTINGTLQRVTLLQSMIKHSGCVNNVWWNSQASKPGQYAKNELDTAPAMLTAEEFGDAIGAAVYDDTGPFAEEANRLDALISELLA